MLYQLVKRDPAWRYLGYMVLAAAVIWPVTARSPRPGVLGFTLFGCIWFVVGGLVGIHRRATSFEAGLPVEARQLYLARVLSLLATIWLPIAAALVCVLAVRGLSPVIPSLLEIACMLSLALMVAQSIRVPEFAAPSWVLMAIWPAFTSLGMGVALFGSTSIVAVVSGLCAALAVAFFILTWTRIPESFQCAPQAASAERVATVKTAMPGSLWWPIYRSLFTWISVMNVSFFFVFPLLDNGLYTSLWMPSVLAQSHAGLPWLFALPIRRRTLLRIMLVPALALLCVAYFINVNWGLGSRTRNTDRVYVGYSELGGWSHAKDIQVPPSFWRWTPEGAAPIVEAPWGERYRPEVAHWRGLALYNPYSAGDASSSAFRDWQFQRANRAVYGDAATSKIPITRQARGQIITLAALMAMSLIVVVAVYLPYWSRLRNVPKPVIYVMVGCLYAVVMALFLGDTLFLVTAEQHAFSKALFIHAARLLPENLAALIAISLIMIGALWALVEKVYSEIDLPAPAKRIV